jgi:hypothetical protein
MAAKVFDCYPFAHFFEEKVTHLLAGSLDDSFYLIHNVIRPNKNPNSLLPKEIDLCVLSRSSKAIFVEIKHYYNPTIDDASIEGKPPNPVLEMKEYGQRLRTDLSEGSEYPFETIPILIVPKKDAKKIKSKWNPNCKEPLEFVDWCRRKSRAWYQKAHKVSDLDLERIRENYFCCVNVKPFAGFDYGDLESLSKSKKYSAETWDKEFKEEVLQPLYFKFRCMAYDIRSFFQGTGTTLFQYVMSPEQTMPQPIYYVAFVLRDVPTFLTEPQVAFHISTKDWFMTEKVPGDHYATKLGFFESSGWMRKLMIRFREQPARFTSIVKESLSGQGYRLTSSRDPNINFINTPTSSHELQADLERLAKLVLDEGIKLRSICFERPIFEIDWSVLGSRDRLKNEISEHFVMLLDLLKKLLPEYFEEVEKSRCH